MVLPILCKILVFTGVIISFFVVYRAGLSFVRLFILEPRSRSFYFLGGIWFIPIISTSLFIVALKIGANLLKFVDQGWVEYLGGQGLIKTLNIKGVRLDYSLFTGVQVYLIVFFIILGFIVWFTYLNSLSKEHGFEEAGVNFYFLNN